MFVGRENELSVLEDAYRSSRGELVVLYGRRRIGKSSLVKRFAQSRPRFFAFEALEGERTAAQVRHFTECLREQTGDAVLASVDFGNWTKLFSYLWALTAVL